MSRHSHRPSSGLKQTNKSHNVGSTSKGELRDRSKGRVDQRNHPKSSSKTPNQSKAARRNQAKQIQQQKRQTLIANNRAASSPRVVVCLSPTDDVDAVGTAKILFGEELDLSAHSIGHPRPTELQVLTPSLHDLYGCLDVCAAADYVLLLLSSTVEVDGQGETLLRSLCALGIPENGVRGIICGDVAPTADIRRSLLSFSQHFFGPSLARLYAAGEKGEVSNLIRSLCEAASKGIHWREERGRVLIEESEWRNEELRLTGIIRGAAMSASRLIHLPGIGDCQLEKIIAAPLLKSFSKGKGKMDVEMEEELVLSERLNHEADDLQSLNSVDPLDELQNEQTWPTEEEMANAPAGTGERIPDAVEGTTPRLKKVPKGTSAYQATWIVEEAESEDSDDDMMEEEETEQPHAEDEDEFELLDQNAPSTSGGKGLSFADVDDEEADTMAVEQERSRWRAARDEEQYPDEIDTPMHIPARERFARYRGLRSFRTSPWDPYENLPSDYAKIFMFRDWRATARSIARQEASDDSSVQPGTRVTLVLRLPEGRTQQAVPLVAWALHKHEHKTSVAHCTVLRNTEFADDVRSKDSVVVHIGPRRYVVNPLYSQHTQANAGKGSNNVHKFERFLPKDQGGAPAMATAFLPVTFGATVPSLFFRDGEDEATPTFIGSGILHSCDPTRVVAKRIILTGHPVKVHKRTATIRYLFFNPEDVAYFKPIQLRTKRGRTGYIKESLGTHGLLKAGFDGPLMQTDTVCLSLYKRVFPKVFSQLHAAGPAQQAMVE